eukprot:m.86508 g.86508  ORF g.86508 m.86508 type:complete len:296 (+) comp36501_c0_seq2:32-919(+)
MSKFFCLLFILSAAVLAETLLLKKAPAREIQDVTRTKRDSLSQDKVRQRRVSETPTKTGHPSLCSDNPLPFIPVNYTAKSCVDHMSNGAKSCGYYIINDGIESYTVFCDINSELGTAYTLIASFALKFNSRFKGKSFTQDFPVSHNSPRWDYYRLPKDRMTRLSSVSTHWRATCNFNKVGFTYTDYVRVKMSELNPVTYLGSGTCIPVELINIRGRLRFPTTVAFWQTLNQYNLHHDSSANYCKLKATSGAKSSEDNWGFYSTTNPAFSCTSSQESTTQFWFGGNAEAPKDSKKG